MEQERLTKTCYACRQMLPVKSFWKNAANWDGLNYKCRKCQNEYTNAWNAANPIKRQKINQDFSARGVSELSDCYVRRTYGQRAGLRLANIPQEIIDLKRIQMKIDRQLKEMKK